MDGVRQPRSRSIRMKHYSLLAIGGFWVMDYGLWIMDYGLWIMDYGLWIMDYGLWVWELQVIKVLNCKLWALGL
jgi:hypothetical protein